MKPMLFAFFCLALCALNASEVRWNCFQLQTTLMGDEGVGCYYYDSGRSSPEIGLRYFYNSTGSRLTKIDGKGENVNAGWNVGIWVLAMAGDILSKEYFTQPHIVLKDSYNSMIDGSSHLPQPSPISVNSIGDSVGVANGDKFYLALIGYWYDSSGDSMDIGAIPDVADFYGWVEFEATRTELNILGSAFSYSPLVVGAGAVAIPEPSGALLVLLGLSTIALRRRGGGTPFAAHSHKPTQRRQLASRFLR